LADGISVIPVRADGSKAPALPTWKEYQSRLPTAEELQRWFADDRYGIAILAGRISGNLEIIDFDDLVTYQRWALIRPDLAARLPQVATPGDGRHLFYRRLEQPPGNRKLAQRLLIDPSTGERRVKTLIETRGEGGYVVAPGSPCACHVAGRPYQFVPDLALPPIPCLERRLSGTGEYDDLADSLRDFDELVLPQAHEWTPRPGQGASADPSALPGSDYSQRGSWHPLLTRHGWTYLGPRGALDHWSRPGKTPPGTSATSGVRTDCGKDLLYVFSSNASPLEPGRSYSRFAAMAALEYGGNYGVCAQALLLTGYGIPRQPQGRIISRRLLASSPDTPPVIRTGRPGHYLLRFKVEINE
jgi:putative DNA primase/helicase